MYVVTVAEMRAAEGAAFAAGIGEAELQATAGTAVAQHAARLGPTGAIVVLVGVGNNGRDGWVAACALARAGRTVRLYLLPRHALSEAELAELVGAGGRVHLHAGAESLHLLATWLRDATVAVDGLLGIGARGAPRPPLSDVTGLLNEIRTESRGLLHVLAIDVPSGVDADSGAAVGQCVQADATVVLGAVKQGLLRFPAAERAGALLAGDLGLPPEVLTGHPLRTLDRSIVLDDVPVRAPSGHKGTFGRVVVVGGSPDYFGAPYLAGAGALRGGCGLLAFAAAPRLQSVLAGLLPEATYLRLPDRAPEEHPEAAAATVLDALQGAQALLLGPGLGRSAGARAFVSTMLAERARAHGDVPSVIDADALYAIALEPSLLKTLGPRSILTPHHGEMARLTERPAAEIAAQPWETALEAARRWGAVVVLKGPFTVVAVPDGSAWIWPHANAALGTGGTGDVLAGVIAGLLAQGVEVAAAARLGVYVHAVAALALLARTGTDLLLASDLPREVARQLSALRGRRGDAAPWRLWGLPGWV
jgi:NAD(P)H-hydrate epimerase